MTTKSAAKPPQRGRKEEYKNEKTTNNTSNRCKKDEMHKETQQLQTK